jgi:hypothetical protein
MRRQVSEIRLLDGSAEGLANPMKRAGNECCRLRLYVETLTLFAE